jgi:hypothetical protein
MPAENLIELYNFEGNVEAAFKSWLADNQVELYQTIEFDILPDDYIGAKLELGSVTGHYNPAPGGAATPEYDQYTCSLEITIRTARFDESGDVTSPLRSRHQALTAAMRTWLSISQAKGSALEGYLNYYAFEFLRPAGTAHSQESEFDETTLSFDGQISVLPSAFPVL